MDMKQLRNDPNTFYRQMERDAMDQAIGDLIEGGASLAEATEQVEANMWEATLAPYNWETE